MQRLIDRYNVIGTVTVKGTPVPVFDIPMMTDEYWNQLAAVHKARKGSEHELSGK